MGFFEDFAGDIMNEVADIPGKVEDAAEKLASIADRLGLGKVADVARTVGKTAGVLDIGPTPILVGGQKAIQAMLWATGSNDREIESGEGFFNGSRAFRDERQSLTHADPDSTWDGGSAPRAYERRLDDQLDRLSILVDADSDVATIVSREAGEIIETRRILENLHNWLAEYGKYTQTLGVIPGVGKALQMEAEMLAVGLALKDAGDKMWEMHDDANTNAAGVREALALYEDVSMSATQQDSVGDFDPPRSIDTEDRRIASATIQSLASLQDNAARGINSAVLSVQGTGDNMTATHGMICAVTNNAVKAAESERATAGTRTAGVCTELAGKLRDAAQKYDETDLAEKGNLDQQMPPR